MLKEYLSTLANAFRLKLGTTEKINAQDFPNKVTEVYNAGYEKGKGEGGTDDFYNTFWDAYQQDGDRENYIRAFSGAGWTNVTFKPKYDIKPTDADHMFYLSRITTLNPAIIGKTVDFSGATSILWLFRDCTTLVEVGDININKVCTSIQYLFRYCYSLTTVGTVTMHEGITGANQAFLGCSNLTTIEFAGTIGVALDFADCKLLTEASVTSIIGALKQLGEDETAKTIKFNPNIVLTTKKKADIIDKGWSLIQ